MKEIFLQPTPKIQSDEENLWEEPVSRRIALGLIGAAILAPKQLIASESADVYQWKKTLNNFVGRTCPGAAARQIQEQIFRAPAYRSPMFSDFHCSFAAPYELELRIHPLVTIGGGRYFEFDRLPYFDTHQPCRRNKDINDVELTRLLAEAEHYGGLILSPCGERRPMRFRREQEDFERTARTYHIKDGYYTDASHWNHRYLRPATDGQRTILVHGVEPRRDGPMAGHPKQVFLSKDSF